jgi:glutamate 5-kinase
MQAKLAAAKRATAHGVETWIASGRNPTVLTDILAGVFGVGTRFRAH